MTIFNSATRIVLLAIVFAIIAMNFLQIEVVEPLKSIGLVVISYYFGKKSQEEKPLPITEDKDGN